jgi:hypothetical protein
LEFQLLGFDLAIRLQSHSDIPMPAAGALLPDPNPVSRLEKPRNVNMRRTLAPRPVAQKVEQHNSAASHRKVLKHSQR